MVSMGLYWVRKRPASDYPMRQKTGRLRFEYFSGLLAVSEAVEIQKVPVATTATFMYWRRTEHENAPDRVKG
jgi:hypothetical protein